MSLRLLSAALCIEVGAAAVFAQQPSFAGRWAAAPDSTASGAGPATGSPDHASRRVGRSTIHHAHRLHKAV